MSTPRLYIGNRNYSSWSLRPWLFMSEHPFTETAGLDPSRRKVHRAQVARARSAARAGDGRQRRPGRGIAVRSFR